MQLRFTKKCIHTLSISFYCFVIVFSSFFSILLLCENDFLMIFFKYFVSSLNTAVQSTTYELVLTVSRAQKKTE